MRSEYIISLQRQPRRNDADKHAQIKRSDRKIKNKGLWQCKSAFFLNILLKKAILDLPA